MYSVKAVFLRLFVQLFHIFLGALNASEAVDEVLQLIYAQNGLVVNFIVFGQSKIIIKPAYPRYIGTARV